MKLIGPAHSSQFMEPHNSSITVLITCYMWPKCFLKIAEKPNNYQFHLPNFTNFVTISHINDWDQINS